MNETKLASKFVNKRVCFATDSIRNDFFEKLKHRLGSWTNLRKNLYTYKSRIEKFRSGAISLPYETFAQLLKSFDRDDQVFFLNNIALKDRNWGRVKGGIVTYAKHREIFEAGRKLGAKFREKNPKYKFRLDTPLTYELSELIGAFIGDGFTNRYGHRYTIQFTGHNELDRNYHMNTLIPAIKKIGPGSNPILSNFENTLRLTVNAKEFYLLLTKRFKFKPGKKAYSVCIPDEILRSKDPYITNYCIRGIFDTDGGVYFDRRKSYKAPYIRVGLQMQSRRLVGQIYKLLLEQNIKATITKSGRTIQINGPNGCKKFTEVVGFSNSRHLRKIKDFYKF
jgi:hypothetical protein